MAKQGMLAIGLTESDINAYAAATGHILHHWDQFISQAYADIHDALHEESDADDACGSLEDFATFKESGDSRKEEMEASYGKLRAIQDSIAEHRAAEALEGLTEFLEAAADILGAKRAREAEKPRKGARTAKRRMESVK